MDDPRADGLTAAQRRAVLSADAVTGEVTGPPALRDALVALGLAVRHGARRAAYLTAEGRRLRDAPPGEGALGAEGLAGAGEAAGSGGGAGSEGLARSEGAARAGGIPAAAVPGAFEPNTGDGTGPPDGPGRDREVAAAWNSLLAVRALTGAGDVPAPWERHPARLVRAVSLALESAGLPPAALDPHGRRTRPGYRVTSAPDPSTVHVHWAGPAAPRESATQLARCAAALTDRGWDSLTYFGPRRIPFLAVTPQG